MQFHPNTEIINMLLQYPGRMKSFLLEVPINFLRDALQEQQLLQDLRYRTQQDLRRSQQDPLRGQQNSNLYRQNVLDFTLSAIIKQCKIQGIINFFEFKIAEEQSRLCNHSQFGLKLVRRFPEKYYVGQKSSHFNHAPQIEKSYGIQRNSNLTDSQNDSPNQEASMNQGQQSQNNEKGDENNGKNSDPSQFKPNNKNEINQQSQQQNQEDYENENSFIVDDQDQEIYCSDVIDELEKKAQKIKKQRKSPKKSQLTQKNSRKQKQVPQPSDKTQKIGQLKKALRRQSDENSESQSQSKSLQSESDQALMEAILINQIVPQNSSKKQVVKNKRNLKTQQHNVKNKMRVDSSSQEDESNKDDQSYLEDYNQTRRSPRDKKMLMRKKMDVGSDSE